MILRKDVRPLFFVFIPISNTNSYLCTYTRHTEHPLYFCLDLNYLQSKFLVQTVMQICHVFASQQALKLICLKNSQWSLSVLLPCNSLYTKALFSVMRVERARCSVLSNWRCQASLCWLVSQSDRITQSTWREEWKKAWAKFFLKKEKKKKKAEWKEMQVVRRWWAA